MMARDWPPIQSTFLHIRLTFSGCARNVPFVGSGTAYDSEISTTGVFGGIKFTLRSEQDPFITALKVTRGTLFFGYIVVRPNSMEIDRSGPKSHQWSHLVGDWMCRHLLFMLCLGSQWSTSRSR